MCRYTRAVLRNASGEHMMALTKEEIEAYEFLAERGEVERFVKVKKGRPTLIFKLSAPKNIYIEPSQSRMSDVSLTEYDSQALVGCFGEVTRAQIERWVGFGLVSAA